MGPMKKIPTNPGSLLLTTFLAVLAACSLLPGADAVAGNPHLRDGWLIGMGYGYGEGEVKALGEADSYSYRGGATPQIRFGRMLGKHLALHLEYGGWMLEDGVLPYKARVSMQDVALAATWFPGNPDTWTGGWYLRGGVGLGWASIALVEIEDQEQIWSDRLDESGLGLLAALGYEWRFVEDVAAGLGLGVQHLNIQGDFYQETTFVPFTFSVNWYWD